MKFSQFNPTIQEGIKYIFVGGLCTLVDFSLLYLLTEIGHVGYLLSSSISFICGVILNYFLCTLWIFDKHLVKNRSVEFLLYLLISLIGLGINTLVIWLSTEKLGTHYMVSKLFAASITYFWNFFARKFLLHTREL